MVKQFRLLVTRLMPACLMAISVVSAVAQEKTQQPTPQQAHPTPVAAKGLQKPTTAEQVADTALLVYTGGRGEQDQVRKTISERGKSKVTSTDGQVENINYQRFVIRGETLAKERVRLDQELPTAKFSLVFADEKTLGVFNNTVFTPRRDAVDTFENQIFHGIDALLRYRSNESKLELAPQAKVLGVDYFVVDLTDKQGRKTRYFVSAKSYRVMILTYDEGGISYRRRFYDYNYAQGALVPFRTVLWANDKQIEETEIGTITFGQKVDEELFRVS